MAKFEEVIFYLKKGNSNDYTLYEKSYMKKSKKVLTNLEESRSKSNPRITNQQRDTSPLFKINSNIRNDFIDTKKYVSGNLT